MTDAALVVEAHPRRGGRARNLFIQAVPALCVTLALLAGLLWNFTTAIVVLAGGILGATCGPRGALLTELLLLASGGIAQWWSA